MYWFEPEARASTWLRRPSTGGTVVPEVRCTLPGYTSCTSSRYHLRMPAVSPQSGTCPPRHGRPARPPWTHVLGLPSSYMLVGLTRLGLRPRLVNPEHQPGVTPSFGPWPLLTETRPWPSRGVLSVPDQLSNRAWLSQRRSQGRARTSPCHGSDLARVSAPPRLWPSPNTRLIQVMAEPRREPRRGHDQAQCHDPGLVTLPHYGLRPVLGPK